MEMSIERIRELQKGYKVTRMQEMIESGEIWKFEGTMGRTAMTCLEAGICFLGEKPTTDYYGNFIPARGMLELATKGSLENAQEFWQKVWDGNFEVIEALEEMFGYEPEDEIA